MKLVSYQALGFPGFSLKLKREIDKPCRVFAVPPQIVGFLESSSFANSAVASSWFVSFALPPWCKALEEEFACVTFNDPVCVGVEFDLTSLQRGDQTSRLQSMTVLHRPGLVTANEARGE